MASSAAAGARAAALGVGQERLDNIFERCNSERGVREKQGETRDMEVCAHAARSRAAHNGARAPAARQGIQRARGKRHRHSPHHRRVGFNGRPRLLPQRRRPHNPHGRRKGGHTRVRREAPQRQDRHDNLRLQPVHSIAHDAQPRLAEEEFREGGHRGDRRRQHGDRHRARHEREQAQRA